MTSGAHMYVPLYVCVCNACNRVILVATAVNGKFSMKTDENILNLVFNIFVCVLLHSLCCFLCPSLSHAKSNLIMTYSLLCCCMHFLIYFVSCFAWAVLRRAKANTHKGLSSLFKVRGNSTQIFRWYFSLLFALYFFAFQVAALENIFFGCFDKFA